MMNTRNMFVFAVAFLLLSLSYTTSTDGLSLRVAAPATSSTVDARPVQISNVELSTPPAVTGVPVAHVVQVPVEGVPSAVEVAHVVQVTGVPWAQDPSAQVPVEGVPVEGVPLPVPVEGVPVEGRRAQSLSEVLDDILPNRSSSSDSRRRPTYGERTRGRQLIFVGVSIVTMVFAITCIFFAFFYHKLFAMPTPEEGEVIVDLEQSLIPKIWGDEVHIGDLEFDYATVVDGDGNSHQFTLDDIQANGFDVEKGQYLRIDPDALLINGEHDPEAVVADVNYDFKRTFTFALDDPDNYTEGETSARYLDIKFTEGEDVNIVTGHVLREGKGSYTFNFNELENDLVRRG